MALNEGIKSQQDAWEDFKIQVLSQHNLGKDLLWLMETVFFSGGKAMHYLMLTATEPDDDEECERRLLAIGEELEEFYARMKQRNWEAIEEQINAAKN